MLAYNASPHRANEGISPAELFIGRRMMLAIDVAIRGEAETVLKPTDAALDTRENALRAMEWLKIQRTRYEKNMEV